MEPTSPIVNGMENEEIVYAKDQPQYVPLPVLKSRKEDRDGRILMRWQFNEQERVAIANGADLVVSILTYQQPLQPLGMFVSWDNEGLLKYFLENYR